MSSSNGVDIQLALVAQWVMQFKDEIRKWRGKLYQKEAADKLDIPLATYRKYEIGKRTPQKLAMIELKRRMQ